MASKEGIQSPDEINAFIRWFICVHPHSD